MTQDTLNKIEKLHDEIYRMGYQDGVKDGNIDSETLINKIQEAYNNGLTDAWECARRLTHPRYGGYRDSEQKKIFGYENSDDVLTEYSASEAIQKIKEYEEKKKQPDEFEIGDEVISIYGSKGCVTGFHGDELCVLYRNGTVGHSTKCTYKKTGRQFPFLVAVLNEMKESD